MRQRFYIFILPVLLVFSGFPAQAGEQESPLTMHAILRHVYLHNPDLAASRAELRATQELYPQALAGWRPTARAEAGIYTTNIESSNFSQGTGATTKNFSLNIEQPLFRGGRTMAQSAQAKSLIMAARAQSLRLQSDVLRMAALAYLAVIRDRTLVSLRRESEQLLYTELTAAQARFEGGDLTRTDVHQAEARLARLRAQMSGAESQLAASNAAFENITGLAPADTLFYPDDALPFQEFFQAAPAAIAQNLEAGNAELMAAEYIYEAAKHQIEDEFRSLFPTISAYAGYNKEYDPQPGIIPSTESETIGLRASIPLYEGGATRSRVRQAKNTAAQRYLEIASTRRRVRAEISRQWQSMQSAEREIQLRSYEIEASLKAAQGIKEEAQMGMRSVQDTLDAEQAVLDSRLALAMARYERLAASYTLAATLGHLTPDYIGVTEETFDADAHLSRISGQAFSMNAQEITQSAR